MGTNAPTMKAGIERKKPMTATKRLLEHSLRYLADLLSVTNHHNYSHVRTNEYDKGCNNDNNITIMATRLLLPNDKKQNKNKQKKHQK